MNKINLLSDSELAQVSGGVPWYAIGSAIYFYGAVLDTSRAFGQGLGSGFYDGRNSRQEP